MSPHDASFGSPGQRDRRRAPQLLPGVRIVAGDEAGLLRVALATVGAGDEDAVGDDRAAVPAEAQRVVGLDRLPHLLAGPRVERDEIHVGRGEEQLVAVERQRAGGAGPRVFRQPVAVDPDDVAGRRVERLNDVPRVGEEHDAVVHQRGRLVVPLPDRDRPGEVQLADVVARNLVESAVAVAVAGPAPAQPVAGRRVGEHLVGDRAQIVRHHQVDEPCRSPPRPFARPGRAARLLDVRRIADWHPRIHRQGPVAGYGAVRLEHVRHQAQVGPVAERAGLPRGHLVAQVGEQLVGRPPRPTVQEVDADEGRRVHHALQARPVTLLALHAVDRPAVGRLVPGEGPVRRRALRRRRLRRHADDTGNDTRPGGDAAHQEQSGGGRPHHRYAQPTPVRRTTTRVPFDMIATPRRRRRAPADRLARRAALIPPTHRRRRLNSADRTDGRSRRDLRGGAPRPPRFGTAAEREGRERNVRGRDPGRPSEHGPPGTRFEPSFAMRLPRSRSGRRSASAADP